MHPTYGFTEYPPTGKFDFVMIFFGFHIPYQDIFRSHFFHARCTSNTFSNGFRKFLHHISIAYDRFKIFLHKNRYIPLMRLIRKRPCPFRLQYGFFCSERLSWFLQRSNQYQEDRPLQDHQKAAQRSHDNALPLHDSSMLQCARVLIFW